MNYDTHWKPVGSQTRVDPKFLFSEKKKSNKNHNLCFSQINLLTCEFSSCHWQNYWSLSQIIFLRKEIFRNLCHSWLIEYKVNLTLIRGQCNMHTIGKFVMCSVISTSIKANEELKEKVFSLFSCFSQTNYILLLGPKIGFTNHIYKQTENVDGIFSLASQLSSQ